MSVEYVYTVADHLTRARKDHTDGMQISGAGMYSKVWHKPGQPYVVKIMRGYDLGYREYVNSVEGTEFSYFPKILREIHYCFPGNQESPEWIVFYIEKLSDISKRKSVENFAAILENCVYKELKGTLDLKKYRPKHSKLIQHLSAIAKKDPTKIIVDIHEGNIMRRGREYVVTDPFVYDTLC